MRAEPLERFDEWLREAQAAGAPLPEAMTLATADADGRPSARTVLLNGVDERGFAFFTNYESRKGADLAANPRAALVFLWHTEPRRQVLVAGRVERLPDEESDAYFATRPSGSRLAAWASRQSTPLAGRDNHLVIGAVSYAAGNVLRGAAVQTWNEPILGGLIGASVGLVLHFFTSSNTRHFWGILKSADRRGLLLYILSGIMTITGQICVIASFWYMPVSLANLIALSTPILVTPMSYFLLRNQEGITLRTIFGSTLVLSGITIILLV